MANCESAILTFEDNCHIESTNIQNNFRNGNNKKFCSPEGERLPHFRRTTLGNMSKILTIPELDAEFSPLGSYQLARLLDEELNDETSALLFIVSEYSICSFKGTAGPKSCTQEELRQYLEQIIPLSTETKLECLEKVASIQRPDFVLEFNVIEGSGLKFKNLSGGLFCKMWMKRDAKVAKFTKAVNQGRNPIWNASDFLPLKTTDGSALLIDIHRKDIEKEDNISNDCTKESGNGSCENVSEIIQELDGKLKGRSKMKTADIYCEGSDSWIPIKSPRNRNLKGHLHIAAKLKVSGYYCGLNALKRHLLLIKLCVQDHLGDSDEMVTWWDNILTSVSLTLVYLHSIIESIPVCEDTICWFAVVNHLVIWEKKVSFQFRYTLLRNCVKSLRKLSKINCNVELSFTDMYEKEFESLKKECLTYIENLHLHDLGGDKYKRRDFEYALRTILLSKAVLGMRCEALTILKSEAQQWYEKITKEIAASEDKPKYFIETLEYQKEFQVSADKVLAKVYPGRTYTSVIYDHIDKFINETVKKCIQDLTVVSFESEEEAEVQMSIALKVFQVSKRFILYTYRATNESELKFLEMCDWFGIEVIQNGFDWKKRVAVRQIKMALCFDDAMHVNSISLGSGQEKFSSSVKVVPDIIRNCLTDLWELVSISGPSRYDALFINALHECCTVFASGLIERNSSKNTFGDSLKTGKKRLCVLANGMNVMATFIEHTICTTVGTLCEDLPKSADYLMDLSWKLCTQISGMHEPVIDKRVKKMSQSRSKLTQSMEVKKYTAFTERVVWKEARRYMILDVFLKFLQELWSYTLVVIEKTAFNREEEESANSKRKFSKCKCNFKGLLQVLKETEKLCSLDDRAIFTKFLWNDDVKSLQKKLMDASKNV